MSAFRRRVALSVATVVASAVGAAAPTLLAPASSPRAAAPQGADPAAVAARATLAEVRALFTEPAPTAYARRAVASAGAREATLALRDLSVALPDLDGDDARVAQRLLARPTDDAGPSDEGLHYDAPARSDCTDHLCVHWVEEGADAVAPADADGDGVPSWVETTQQTLETAWRHHVAAGYRPPRGDGDRPSSGPDDKVDVYLADVASLGFYGYCTTDGLTPDTRTAPGFCVLDNDYAYQQVSTEPILALRATAAHELFHLVQFAYDAREDPWFMEGTATWVEDEVFDGVNDNWNYLSSSTLAHPGVPVDYGEDYYPYGAWTWWRFLSEYFGTSRKAAPQVVRAIWEAAVKRDSLSATRAVLGRLDTSFPRAFTDYSALSHVSRRWYFEGDDAPYPQAPMARSFTLDRRTPDTGGLRSLRLDHLSSANVSVRRSPTLTGRPQLRIWVEGPARTTGPGVALTLHRTDGTLGWRTMQLDADGDGVLTVPFARGKVARVVVTLVNASTRMDCDRDSTLACSGLPRDDGRTFAYRARAVR